MELRKGELLLHEEQTWRLRSRAIWIKEGYKNTGFFHKYASSRKNVNAIWYLEDETGKSCSSLPELKRTAVNFFKKKYDKPVREDLEAQLQALRDMPRFFSAEDNEQIWKPVTKEELEAVIKGMPKDKSPGPDGSTQEFFSWFFDLVS